MNIQHIPRDLTWDNRLSVGYLSQFEAEIASDWYFNKRYLHLIEITLFGHGFYIAWGVSNNQQENHG